MLASIIFTLALPGAEILDLKEIGDHIRGWLPKEPNIAYARNHLHSRLRKPKWIALTTIAFTALAFATYLGVQTYLRYSNPQLDLTASYYQKSSNCSHVSVGDSVEVNVIVYWHGYVIPEFKRHVEIVDNFPEENFQLVSGSNILESDGYGGTYQIKYTLKVVADTFCFPQLDKPRLYLDNQATYFPEETDMAFQVSGPKLNKLNQ